MVAHARRQLFYEVDWGTSVVLQYLHCGAIRHRNRLSRERFLRDTVVTQTVKPNATTRPIKTTNVRSLLNRDV